MYVYLLGALTVLESHAYAEGEDEIARNERDRRRVGVHLQTKSFEKESRTTISFCTRCESVKREQFC